MTDRKKKQLLVVAHGERGGSRDDRLAHGVLARLRKGGKFARVEMGFLNGAPAIEDAAARLEGGALHIYPLFMSEGYFVTTMIPKRLKLEGDVHGRWQAVHVERALGLDPAFPALACALAARTAKAAGKPPAETTLLLAAHGSAKSGASAEATRAVAKAIEKMETFKAVTVAYLEQPPFLPAALQRVAGPAILLGLFAGEGLHGAEDVPEALAASGRSDIFAAPPLAREDALIDLIAKRLESDEP